MFVLNKPVASPPQWVASSARRASTSGTSGREFLVNPVEEKPKSLRFVRVVDDVSLTTGSKGRSRLVRIDDQLILALAASTRARSCHPDSSVEDGSGVLDFFWGPFRVPTSLQSAHDCFLGGVPLVVRVRQVGTSMSKIL